MFYRMEYIQRKSLPCLLLLLFCLPFPGNAQTTDSAVLVTLEESIARALNFNNQVRSSELGIKKAVWDKRYAWTMLMPTVSFNSGYTRIDDQTLAERDFTRYLPPELNVPKTVFQESWYSSFEMSMPLFNGSLLNGLAVAGANEKMARNLSESTRNSIVFQVVSAYLNVMRSSDILQLQEEYLSLSRLNYEKAERLYNAGRYSKTEAMRWKVDFQQQKSTVTSSRSALRSATAVLSRLINTDMLQELRVESSVPDVLTTESTILDANSENEILTMIQLDDEALIKANAALASAKSNERIGKLLYRNSISAYLPNLSLSYSYAWRENNTVELDDYSPKTLRVNLSIPVFTGFQNFTSVKSSYYEYKAGQEDFSDRLKDTRYVLTETANKIINLKTQRELSKTNVEFNKHNYQIVEQQKEKGLVSNIEFIDAKLNYQSARLDDISNQYDFISSMVELYYLLGKIERFIH